MSVAPPEVITGRLMSGAGPGPMAAASAAFGAASTALGETNDRLVAQLAWLQTHWLGPAAESMAVSLTKHLSWLRVLEVQLDEAAARTAAQAAAFSQAYATMVPMPAIVANRVTLSSLEATNFLGVNAIPIAATEAQYLEMTIQDITVQSTYLAQTIANTTFEPFTPMPGPIVLGEFPIPAIFQPAVSSAVNAGEQLRQAAVAAQAPGDGA